LRLSRFTVLIFATAAAMLVASEAATEAGFVRRSRIQKRQKSQRQAVLALHQTAANGLPTVALLGNSLLLEAIDAPVLDAKVRNRIAIQTYYVDQTGFYDWYYGLRALFAEGLHPRYVLLGLTGPQLAATGVLADYSSRYLFQASDLLEIARTTHMDATSASEMILAHYSAYYALRSNIHGVLRARLAPGLAGFLFGIRDVVLGAELGDADLRVVAGERLQALSELCKAHGVQLLFLVPAAPTSGAAAIQLGGQDHRIVVFAPIKDGVFDASYYHDGYHLNAKGSAIFTDALAADLLKAFPNAGAGGN